EMGWASAQTLEEVRLGLASAIHVAEHAAEMLIAPEDRVLFLRELLESLIHCKLRRVTLNRAPGGRPVLARVDACGQRPFRPRVHRALHAVDHADQLLEDLLVQIPDPTRPAEVVELGD